MILMVTTKARQLAARQERRESVSRKLARRRVQNEFKRGFETTELVECDPQGEESRKLKNHLKDLEPRLKDAAARTDDMKAMVGESDKGRQNAMNALAGMQGGDQIIQVYWDKMRLAVSAVADVNRCERTGIHLIRVAPRSDEGVPIIAGRRLSQATRLEFEEALAEADAHLDLSKYTYTIELPDGDGVRRFSLNLEAFAQVLKHGKGMITSCTCELSDPITILPEGRPGFLQDEIKRVENGEVLFYEHLPASFQGISSLAEVRSPFDTNLEKSGIRTLSGGTFVEIKLRMSPGDAAGLLRFTDDGWGKHLGMETSEGTRKGFAEIFSGEIGMRGLNTFIGKARANRVLTAISHALDDYALSTNNLVLPTNGGYLSYWVDASPGPETAHLIRDAIAKRIHSRVRNGIDLDLSFEPSVRTMQASGMSIDDVRARFILKSLGNPLYPTGVLKSTDFLINFIENIKTSVQMDIYRALAEEGSRTLHSLDNIHTIERICSKRQGGRRTIRDTEDLVWVLRNDDDLPADIKARRVDLERWLFDFAWEKASRMFLLLTERVQAEAERIRKEGAKRLLRVV